jgi:hypothetical protein
VLTRLQNLVSAGYAFESASPSAGVAWLRLDGDALIEVDPAALVAQLAPAAAGGIAVVLPTFLGRAAAADHAASLRHLLGELRRARADHARVPLTLLVGMQRDAADHPRALARLGEMIRVALGDGPLPPGLQLAAFTLPMSHKVVTLNAAFALVEPLRLRGVGWADDDVRFSPGAWSQLIGRFVAKGGVGAVGVVKRARAGSPAAARLLTRIKRVTRPAVDYPSGCGILVEAARLRRGIPRRYFSDDGWVCFELLRPRAPDPFERLELVPGAECEHVIDGTASATWRRMRRLMVTHAVFMADYPAATSIFYFRHLLFAGLFPLSPFDRRDGVVCGLQRLALKAIYLGLFAGVVADLFARGLVHRPLRSFQHGSGAGLPRWRPTETVS